MILYMPSYDRKARNFIGRSFYLLHTVPVGGEEKTLTLYSHSGKHQRGQIKLQLNILGLEDSAPPDVAHRNHTILFKTLVNHESKIVSNSHSMDACLLLTVLLHVGWEIHKEMEHETMY